MLTISAQRRKHITLLAQHALADPHERIGEGCGSSRPLQSTSQKAPVFQAVGRMSRSCLWTVEWLAQV